MEDCVRLGANQAAIRVVQSRPLRQEKRNCAHPNRNDHPLLQVRVFKESALDALAFDESAKLGMAPNKNFAVIGAADMIVHLQGRWNQFSRCLSGG